VIGAGVVLGTGVVVATGASQQVSTLQELKSDSHITLLPLLSISSGHTKWPCLAEEHLAFSSQHILAVQESASLGHGTLSP